MAVKGGGSGSWMAVRIASSLAVPKDASVIREVSPDHPRWAARFGDVRIEHPHRSKELGVPDPSFVGNRTGLGRHRQVLCEDMLAYMNRTTVKLPDEVDAQLRHEAERRGITISELTREAIETHLGPRRKLRAAAAGRSGRDDVSERIEELLSDEVTS